MWTCKLYKNSIKLISVANYCTKAGVFLTEVTQIAYCGPVLFAKSRPLYPNQKWDDFFGAGGPIMLMGLSDDF